jgi:hypothetical protein
MDEESEITVVCQPYYKVYMLLFFVWLSPCSINQNQIVPVLGKASAVQERPMLIRLDLPFTYLKGLSSEMDLAESGIK